MPKGQRNTIKKRIFSNCSLKVLLLEKNSDPEEHDSECPQSSEAFPEGVLMETAILFFYLPVSKHSKS